MALGVCAVVGVLLAKSEARLEGNLKELRQRPRVQTDALLGKMRPHAARTRWVFAEPVIYPFHLGLRAPPELAVVMLKRFWSGQITTREVVGTCRRYTPEMIILRQGFDSNCWNEFLDGGYDVAYTDARYVLYVAKRAGRGAGSL